MSEADRLEAMEHAIANMQKSIEEITGRETHEPDTLSDNINALTIQLTKITTALQDRARSFYVKHSNGFYEPWREEKEVLLTHKYVAREVLANVLWRALRTVANFFTGWRAINELLDTMPCHVISRTVRFPAHGHYINVHNFDVFHLIQQLKEHGYRASAEASQGGQTGKFKEVLGQLQTLALANVGSGRTVGMIHDRDTFEEEYKLKWVELDHKHDGVSEVTDGGEVTVTGLSTQV